MEDRHERFLEWITKGGGYVSSKIRLYKSRESGIGVEALEDLSKDELLFAIPRKMILSRKATRHHRDVAKYIPKEGWMPIMWSLILERLDGEESFWKAYFDVLPSEPPPLPMTWSDEDCAYLCGTDLPERIGRPKDQFQQTFLPFAKKFHSTQSLHEEELYRLFHWSGALVSSYSFMENPEGREIDIAMVPMADMLNHRTGHNNARLFYETDQLCMRAIKICSKGEELYNTYGDLGNADLLFMYGFVEDSSNPFTTVKISPEHVQPFTIRFTFPKIIDTFSNSNLSKSRLERASRNLEAEYELSKTTTDNKKPPYKLMRAIQRIFAPEMAVVGTPFQKRQMLDQFAAEHKNQLIQLLNYRKSLYKSPEPTENGINTSSENARLARLLINEEISIIDSWIDYFTDLIGCNADNK